MRCAESFWTLCCADKYCELVDGQGSRPQGELGPAWNRIWVLKADFYSELSNLIKNV